MSQERDLKLQLDKQLSQAKAKLLVEQPYFGTLASRLQTRQNDNIQAFISDGVHLDYNDEYLAELQPSELQFILSNGAMHAALSHDNRQKNRMGWLWQLATDYAINAMLLENGLEMPYGANYRKRFDGMYAEEIYAELKHDIQNEEFDDNEENDTGFNENNQQRQEQMTNAEGDHDKDKKRETMQVENVEHKVTREVDEELFDQFAAEALEKIEKQGDLPLNLDRFFTIIDKTKIDWRHELYKAIDAHYKTDYKMMPPSKKLLYMGTYLPSLHSDTLRLAIAIDSSGSIDKTLLGEFMSEIASLTLSFSNYLIDIFVCDAKIQFYQEFQSGELLDFEIKGGGGTDFRPVFEAIDQEHPQTQLLLYFTDTKGSFPTEIPTYEVIWVSNQKDVEVPFGTVLVID